ncbi:MAG: hypothetical protein ABS921_02460, partial [Psychrobacter alimentarius]
MVSKTPWTQDATTTKSQKSASVTNAKTGLNRRQFLRQVGISAGTGLLAAQSISQVLAANTMDKNSSTSLTKDDLPLVQNGASSQTSRPQISCMTPTIETQLFASSNVGGSDERNQLALDRVACAGFKVSNPTITSRQYLRFAGTDS